MKVGASYLLVPVFCLAIGFSTLTLADQPRVAFVTSVIGNGDLSTWPDAGGATGLAAGDAICRARAAAADLANSNAFVAWLSDTNDDAFCRVHGLSGKRSTSCGQDQLPPPAGPWVRTDGFPFAQTIDRALSFDNEVISPLRFDEFGDEITTTSFMTGTLASGVAYGRDCNDWSSSALSGITLGLGSPNRTHGRWTENGFRFNCVSLAPIACMESGAGPELPDFGPPGRRVFMTSKFGPGDLASWADADAGLSGIAAGDSICRNEATQYGLDSPESFKAWLSDDSVNAIDRLESNGPWVRLDGALVASNKAELTSGRLFVPINVLSRGVYSSGSVHTGTNSAGLAESANCVNWSSAEATDLGSVGPFAASILSEWTASGNPAACNLSRHLYCFSDESQTIFADRFESPAD